MTHVAAGDTTWTVRSAADGADCCVAWCDDLYAYAASFTGGDAAPTEALVERVLAAALAPVDEGATLTLEFAQLLADVRRAVLADASGEAGESRRLRLVLGAEDAARTPRPGYVDALARRVEAGRLSSAAARRRRSCGPEAVAVVVVVVSLLVVLVTVVAARHDGTDRRGAPVPTTVPASLASTSNHQNLKTTGSSVEAVRAYLEALAQAKYDDAAALLRGGAVTLDRRADLRPIFDQLGDLPTALGNWCRQQAMCRLPDELVDNGNEVQATFMVGGEAVHQSFGTGVYHGSTYVRGLPLVVPQPLRREQPWGLMLTLCPTADVISVMSADLDGDGWYEQVVLQNDGRSSGWSMTVCGTYLSTRLVHLPPYPDLRVYPVRVGHRDILLVGNEDAAATFRGQVWSFDRQRGGGGFSAHRFSVAPAAGTDLGCIDVNGDGSPELVQLTIRYHGGTDVSNSESADYDATAVWPDAVAGTASGTIGLWPNSRTLPTTFAGYCNDRPIVVN